MDPEPWKQFFQHVLDAEEDCHCARELHVFSFQCAECDAGKESTFPDQRDTSKVDDVAASRSSAGGIGIVFAVVESCKVGVTIGLELEFTVEVDEEALGFCLLKVSENGFHRSCMTLFRLGIEAGGAGDGITDVRASVGTQIDQHPNDGAVFPGMLWPIFIKFGFPKWFRCSWDMIVVAVRHFGCLKDFGDESFLEKMEASVVEFANLHAEKGFKVSF